MHISISELLVILLVALLVIKPEKLPSAAYTLGRWFKWGQQAIAQFKQEIEKPFINDSSISRAQNKMTQTKDECDSL